MFLFVLKMEILEKIVRVVNIAAMFLNSDLHSNLTLENISSTSSRHTLLFGYGNNYITEHYVRSR